MRSPPVVGKSNSGSVSPGFLEPLWNPDRGVGRRAVLIVDKGGVIRHRKEYEPGTLPDPQEFLELLDGLNG